jgi:hypothetical protein
MERHKYSEGFERFWFLWCRITKNQQGKYAAYRYWRRDRLEKDADEITEALKKQAAERKNRKARGYWVARWCWAQKWLNERRYEDGVEPEIEQQKPPEPAEHFEPADPEKVAEGKKKMLKAIKPVYYSFKSQADKEAHQQKVRRQLLGKD